MIEVNPISELRSKKKISKTRVVLAGWGTAAILTGCRGVQPLPEHPLPLPTRTPFATQTIDILPSQSPWQILGSAETATPGASSPTVFPTPEIPVASEPTPTPVSEVLSEVNTGSGSEPTIAASPYDSNLIAVTHQRVTYNDSCDLSGVRISTDGGRTYKEVSEEPWYGGCPDFHGQVAWGPGPTPGSSRLWYVDAMILGKGKIAPGVTYSDDLGKTWAPMHIETRTPRWVGGFPDITVDNNQDSPNFGTAYVAYNYLESPHGPGLAVIASGDSGKTWAIVKVPAITLEGYPYDWRIGYRLKTAPDGSAYVSFYQSNLKFWSTDNIFSQGGSDNIGDLGFAVAHLHFNQSVTNTPPLDTEHVSYKLTADPAEWMINLPRKTNLNLPYDPEWQTGLDVDNLGRAWIAVSDNGKIDIGHTDNTISSGNDRQETSPRLSFCMEGQSCFKPSLAISGDMVFVGFHTLAKGMVRTYYMISYDNGETFSTPQLATSYAWSWSSMSNLINNVGLRENATSGVDVNGDPVFFYAFGIGRKGQPNVDVVAINPDTQRNLVSRSQFQPQ